MSLKASIELNNLWAFSLETYAKQGVSELCLSLQNQFGINVNLLLLTSYLDVLQLSLEDSQWATLETSIIKINNSLIALRQARSLIKEVNTEVYDKVLLAELDLEKQTQHQLVDKVNSLPLANSKSPDNLIRFLKFKNIPLPSDLVHLFELSKDLKAH